MVCLNSSFLKHKAEINKKWYIKRDLNRHLLQVDASLPSRSAVTRQTDKLERPHNSLAHAHRGLIISVARI